ncbi:hypothetical protein [Neisseria sp.]|uniref:hypothetical protein n=1 Tax=Neisseria sp. TaxID=192066 RepID=UPI00359F586A
MATITAAINLPFSFRCVAEIRNGRYPDGPHCAGRLKKQAGFVSAVFQTACAAWVTAGYIRLPV